MSAELTYYNIYTLKNKQTNTVWICIGFIYQVLLISFYGKVIASFVCKIYKIFIDKKKKSVKLLLCVV